MTAKEFWNRVKKLIKAHNLTQEQFAKHIDFPIGTLKGAMHFNRYPALPLAVDIAAALGVSVEYLVAGSNCEDKDKHLKEFTDRQIAASISKLALQIHNETEKILKKP